MSGVRDDDHVCDYETTADHLVRCKGEFCRKILPAASLKARGDRIKALESEVERVRSLIHRDRTGLAAALGEIVKEVKGRLWVTEGRGSYEWDDVRYKAEAGEALRAVLALASKALGDSGNLADSAFHPDPKERQWREANHCPTCDSPAPRLHPAMQFEGEVQPCENPFHDKEPFLEEMTPETSPEDGEP